MTAPIKFGPAVVLCISKRSTKKLKNNWKKNGHDVDAFMQKMEQCYIKELFYDNRQEPNRYIKGALNPNFLNLTIKGALNPNFLNLTINREKFWL